MRLFFVLIAFSLFSTAYAITGQEIIGKVDANMTYGTARSEAELVIHIGGEVRTKKLITYGEGKTKSYAEFTFPARDQGVKYLKIEDNMWMYLPEVDKIIKIAGHMLRQSMMGSDFSYEDALESEQMLEKYSATLVSEEVIPVPYHKEGKMVEEPRLCYVVDLTAKVKEVTYFRKMIWVEKSTLTPVREELFALSGKKLKVMNLGDIQKFKNRHYPMYMSLKNLLRQDSLTEMFVRKIEFDVKIPVDTFTQRKLSK